MNGQELVDEVRSNIKRTAAAYTDARILQQLNWGQQRIADTHTFEEMRVYDTSNYETTANLANYSFPTRMKDIYDIVLYDTSESRRLRYMYPRQFDEQVPYPLQAGTGHSTIYVDYGTE